VAGVTSTFRPWVGVTRRGLLSEGVAVPLLTGGALDSPTEETNFGLREEVSVRIAPWWRALVGLEIQGTLAELTVLPGDEAFEGEAAEGVLVTHPFDPDGSERARFFVRRFEARFGHAPDSFAAHAYDAVTCLAAAAARAGSWDRAAVRAELAATRAHPGVTGDLSFDATGNDVRGPPRPDRARALRPRRARKLPSASASASHWRVRGPPLARSWTAAPRASARGRDFRAELARDVPDATIGTPRASATRPVPSGVLEGATLGTPSRS
jgi:hypothetical protein